MAGGFFRENIYEEIVPPQPIVLKDLPKISSDIAKPSVSRALDEATSSTDESGDGLEPEVVIGDGNAVGVPHITIEDFPMPVDEKEIIDLSEKEQVMRKENTESHNAIEIENSLDSMESNEEKIYSNNGNIHIIENSASLEASEQKITKVEKLNLTGNEDPQGTANRIKVGRESSDNVTIDIVTSTEEYENKISSEKDLKTFEDELNDFEDEIKKKKRLIEQLLSNRRAPIVSEPSSSTKSNVGDIYDEKLFEEKPYGEISPQQESNLGDNNESTNEATSVSSAMETTDETARDVCDGEVPEPSVKDIPAQNEFEGKTYVSRFK